MAGPMILVSCDEARDLLAQSGEPIDPSTNSSSKRPYTEISESDPTGRRVRPSPVSSVDHEGEEQGEDEPDDSEDEGMLSDSFRTDAPSSGHFSAAESTSVADDANDDMHGAQGSSTSSPAGADDDRLSPPAPPAGADDDPPSPPTLTRSDAIHPASHTFRIISGIGDMMRGAVRASGGQRSEFSQISLGEASQIISTVFGNQTEDNGDFAGESQILFQITGGPSGPRGITNILSQIPGVEVVSANAIDALDDDEAWHGITNSREIRDIIQDLQPLLLNDIIPSIVAFPFTRDDGLESVNEATMEFAHQLVLNLSPYLIPEAYVSSEEDPGGLARVQRLIGRHMYIISRWRRALTAMMGTIMNMGQDSDVNFSKQQWALFMSLRRLIGKSLFREIPSIYERIIPGFQAYMDQHIPALPSQSASSVNRTETTSSSTIAVPEISTASFSGMAITRSAGLSAASGAGEESDDSDGEATEILDQVELFETEFASSVRPTHLSLSCPICHAFSSRRGRPRNMVELAGLITRQFSLEKDQRRISSGDWDLKKKHILDHVEKFIQLFSRMISAGAHSVEMSDICERYGNSIFEFFSRNGGLIHRDFGANETMDWMSVASVCLPHLSLSVRRSMLPKIMFDHVPRSSGHFSNEEYSSIEVRQEATDAEFFAESIVALQTMDKVDLLGGKVNAKYTASEAIGQGPIKQLISRSLRHAIHPSAGLFEYSDERAIMMKPVDFHASCRQHTPPELIERQLKVYRQVGRLIGLAFVNNLIPGIPLAPSAAAFLTHPRVVPSLGLSQLEEWLEKEDPIQLHGLRAGLAEPIGFIGMDFPGPNHEKRQFMNEDEANEFYHRSLLWRTHESISEQMNAILRGIYDVLPYPRLALLSPEEIMQTFSAPPVIDVADLRASTTYLFGHSVARDQRNPATNQVIQWAWNVIGSMSQEELQQLLEFASGSHLPPLGGFTGEQHDKNWFQIRIDPAHFGYELFEHTAPAATTTSATMDLDTAWTNTISAVQTMTPDDLAGFLLGESQDMASSTQPPRSRPRGPVQVNIPRGQRPSQPESISTTTMPPEEVLPQQQLRRNRLPGSQTCFKQLILGLYDSEEILRDMLLYAIANAKSIDNK